MKKVLAVLLVLVVLGGGGMWWWKTKQASAAATATAATQVVTGKVERGPLQVTVASSGRVVSNQDVDIKCRASGTVTTLPFDVSDEVKKGDILIQLDTKDEEPLVAKARAGLATSKAQLAEAQQDLAVSTQTLEVNRLKAAAGLEAAQAKLDDSKAKTARTRELFEKKLASKEDLETADTAAATAAADVKTAQAAVEDLKTQALMLVLKQHVIEERQGQVDQNQVDLNIQLQQLEYATVRSEVDGIVTAMSGAKDSNGNASVTRIGTVVQSGTSGFSGGTTVMTVTDLSRIFVYASVDESDIGKVIDPLRTPGKEGQKARITVDAYPGVEFEGRVMRVASGTNTSNVVTYEVRIEVISPNKRMLKPLMTANTEIIQADKDDALLVPVAAVILKRRGSAGPATMAATTGEAATQAAPETQSAAAMDGGAPASRPKGRMYAGGWGEKPMPGTVQVVKADGTQEARDVMVGLSTGTMYEVIKGLDEGETVVMNKGGDSKWRGMGGANSMMRTMRK